MLHPASIRTKVQGLLLVFTIVTLGLSAHVNAFQGFFYVADRLPFVMSLITLLILLVSVYSGKKSKISRPGIEAAYLGVLTVIWLCANAFSTSRWQFIQVSDCSSIPVEQNPDFLNQAKTWCYEIQALRAFIWLEWVTLLAYFGGLVYFAMGHASRGAKHVWTTSIGQFDALDNRATRASSFFQTNTTQSGAGYEREFDPTPQMKQEGGYHSQHMQQHQPTGDEVERSSWVEPDQFHRQGDSFQQAQRQPFQQYPHYQTQTAPEWEKFDSPRAV